MIDSVREKLNNYIGKEVIIKYNLGRNKYEQYPAIIKELYQNVFLVQSKNEKRSFSYSDVLTNTIKIDF